MALHSQPSGLAIRQPNHHLPARHIPQTERDRFCLLLTIILQKIKRDLCLAQVIFFFFNNKNNIFISVYSSAVGGVRNRNLTILRVPVVAVHRNLQRLVQTEHRQHQRLVPPRCWGIHRPRLDLLSIQLYSAEQVQLLVPCQTERRFISRHPHLLRSRSQDTYLCPPSPTLSPPQPKPAVSQ